MDSLLRHLLDGVGLDEAATVNEIDAALPWSHVKSNSASPLLLFHRLLELAGIDRTLSASSKHTDRLWADDHLEPAALYPPRDYPALRSLLQAILDSESFDGLKKSSLVYYLLKDYKDGREVAFAKTKRIVRRARTQASLFSSQEAYCPSILAETIPDNSGCLLVLRQRAVRRGNQETMFAWSCARRMSFSLAMTSILPLIQTSALLVCISDPTAPC